MAKRIFVSCNFTDKGVTEQVKSMLAQHQKDIDAQVKFVENDVSYNGQTAIDWEIEHTLEDCDAALFVLGDKFRSSPWLEKEAECAISRHLPIFTTHLPGSDTSAPEVLERCESIEVAQDQPHENLVFPEEVLPRGNAL